MDRAAFVPMPPGTPVPADRWWGRHVRELRWQAELGRLLVDPVFRGAGVPEGDGGPVLLIPGFLAGDSSLSVMATWLRRIGHEPHASTLPFANVHCSDESLDRLEARAARLSARSGRQVSVIGHSRGGHFAKALATRRPDLVNRVVSMGSGLDTPFDISVPTKAAVTGVREVLVRTSSIRGRNGCLTAACRCRFTQDYVAPFPLDIPLTSIYSKGDGVVRWRACIVPYARNVEVRGSHIGLAFNRHAYKVIAEALAPE